MIDSSSIFRSVSISKFCKTLMCMSALSFASQLPSLADAISPAITGEGKVYSKEAANSAYFGTGVSGRMTEASTLRFEGEQETADGQLESAIKKLRKAVQLDPSDPTGHLLFARALSARVRETKLPDEALLNQAISEWKLIWHHDADLLDQYEGHREARSLGKLQKALAKYKEQHPAEFQVAQKQAPEKM